MSACLLWLKQYMLMALHFLHDVGIWLAFGKRNIRFDGRSTETPNSEFSLYI